MILQGLTVSPSPHIKSPITTQKIMGIVLLSLVPSIIASEIIFGMRALFVIFISVASCVLWEYLARIVLKKARTIDDLSAVVTGVILAMNLPVTIPYWMIIIGSFVAIVIVKQLFGGLGQNFANPAIVARIVLFVSFASEMTTWVKPFYYKNGVDMVTSATPLVSGNAKYIDLFLGKTGGSLGETCALALIIGGVFLMVTRVISPSTPVAFIGTVAAMTWIFGGDPLYQVLSGGLLLGAFFMATDYATTPITQRGKIIFGIGCGLITFVIRQWGGMPEGVSFSILLMNIITPYIDMATKKKAVGAKQPEKKSKEAEQ